MTPQRRSGLPLRAALLAAMALPPLSVVALLSWLKTLPPAVVFLLTGIAAVITIAASFVLAILHDRQMDEWTRSNARFSGQWGWTAGGCLVALCLALQPFRDLIVASVANWVHIRSPDQTLVLVTFTFGFMTVVITQLVCMALLSVAWSVWKSRPAREPS